MTDPLIERLKKLTEQQKRGEEAEKEVQNYQQRQDAFVSDHARPEYERLIHLISMRVEAVNMSSALGELSKYQFNAGGQSIQQGVFSAYLYFDKPITNSGRNALLISFAPTSPETWFFSGPPAAERYRLHAVASMGLNKIIWSGDLGEMTSEQLADFILEHLTEYYLANKPA